MSNSYRRRGSWRVEDYEKYTARLRKDHEELVKEYARLKSLYMASLRTTLPLELPSVCHRRGPLVERSRTSLETVYEEAETITTTPPPAETITTTPPPVAETITTTPPVAETITTTPPVAETIITTLPVAVVSPPGTVTNYASVDEIEEHRSPSEASVPPSAELTPCCSMRSSDKDSYSHGSWRNDASPITPRAAAEEEHSEAESSPARHSALTCSDLISYRSESATGSSPSSVGRVSLHFSADVQEDEGHWPELLWCPHEPTETVVLDQYYTERIDCRILGVMKKTFPCSPGDDSSGNSSSRRESTTTCSSLESYVSSEGE